MYVSPQNKQGPLLKLLTAMEGVKPEDCEVIEISQSSVDIALEEVFKLANSGDYTEGKEYPTIRYNGYTLKIVPDVRVVLRDK